MSEEKANEIKNSIIKGTLLDEDQVKVTQEIESYFAGSNRNAGPGNLAWFVYVDIKKNGDEDINKGIIGFIKELCSDREDVEYIGKATETAGYRTTIPGLERHNIVVKSSRS